MASLLAAVSLLCCWGCRGAFAARTPPQDIPRYDLFTKYTVSNAQARGAVCSDGTPYAFYYRNCTANGDRDAGDPTDYCAVGPQGVLTRRWFVYLDPADGAWCHSAASCEARPLRYRSSSGLPDTLFLGGLLSPYPEANPNFYKQHSVYLPSCSNDLFVGARVGPDPASGFHHAGSLIVKAVLEDLRDPALIFDRIAAPLEAADEVVLAGGAGAMLLQDQVGAVLPAHIPPPLGLCDGCVIPLIEPFKPAGSCNNDSACPPEVSLAAAESSWNLTAAAAPVWCDPALPPWRCLVADQLLLRRNQSSRILVQASQLDAGALAMNGVGSGAATAAAREYLARYAAAIRSVATAVSYSFSVGCETFGASDAGLLASEFYYFHQVNCSAPGFMHPPTFEPTQLVATFLTDRFAYPALHCVDPAPIFQHCTRQVSLSGGEY